MRELERSKLTDEQRDLFLKEVTAGVGTREALRRAGITGGSTALTVRRSEARAILAADEDLKHDYDIARGRDIEKVKSRAYDIALDNDHKDSPRLVMYLLDREHPDFRHHAKLEVEHTGNIQIEKREVSLTGVLHVLAEAGALPAELAGPLGHLAAPRDVLPAQSD